MLREISENDVAAVARMTLRLRHTESLDELAAVLLTASAELIDCEHATYNEIDPFFGRTISTCSDAGLEIYLDHDKRAFWQENLHTHPLLTHYQHRPSDQPLQLADVANMRDFYQGALYHGIYRDSDTDHQMVLYLGNDPSLGDGQGIMPLSLGIAVNRKRSAFSARDAQVLALLQALCRPIYRAKRADNYAQMLRSAKLTPEMQRCLMGFGLSERQSEICFWMLQGKTNEEIATILDISPQTVRQHSIQIFQRLGVPGRLAMQQAVILTILRED